MVITYSASLTHWAILVAAATSIAQCVSDAEYVITMLPAGKHVHAVYFGDDGVLTHANHSALLIDCSTIAVDEARSAGTQACVPALRASSTAMVEQSMSRAL